MKSNSIRYLEELSFLQVIQENRIATNLYEKFKYIKLYSYWYRVKNDLVVRVR